MIVRCPRCSITIADVTPETMVYCIACRKWCRAVESAKSVAASNLSAPRPRPRRRTRCH
ncbi:MAG TPA: hypothetical protein VFZ34_31755 [Blastocatellia bacterium]|nr:hypothetical protein [Blastocatellia bacterium]